MIVLISGASHTGKTLLAQKLLEKYNYPYLSLDLLKMGLIRSGQTELTPEDDDKLTNYMWTIVREIIKTAIENRQNLIIEGGYIPFNWKADFDNSYVKEIKHYCLVMSKEYIEQHFDDIKNYANAIEQRPNDSECTKASVIQDNIQNLKMCQKYGCNYILIDDKYSVEIEL